MTIGLLFWGLMVLWLVFGITYRTEIPGGRFGIAGGLFTFILFFLLGWATFGFIVKGP